MVKRFIFLLFASAAWGNQELEFQYDLNHLCESDIHEHLPHLRRLAGECSSVVEMGLCNMVSTWGLLQGLSEREAVPRTYLGIDIFFPPEETLSLAERLAKENGIGFTFLQANTLDVLLAPVDLLFIDTYHTYCQLTQELEKFAPSVKKYIAMHDTSEPWGNQDEGTYGEQKECPSWVDRTRHGLWPAVEDFLIRHPEWKLKERHFNNHGFTVLERSGS